MTILEGLGIKNSNICLKKFIHFCKNHQLWLCLTPWFQNFKILKSGGGLVLMRLNKYKNVQFQISKTFRKNSNTYVHYTVVMIMISH